MKTGLGLLLAVCTGLSAPPSRSTSSAAGPLRLDSRGPSPASPETASPETESPEPVSPETGSTPEVEPTASPDGAAPSGAPSDTSSPTPSVPRSPAPAASTQPVAPTEPTEPAQLEFAEARDPQPPPPASAPLKTVDPVARERVARGRRIMIGSGIAMVASTVVLATGTTIALAVAGSAPDPDDYSDLDDFDADNDRYFRRSRAGNLITGLGFLSLSGSAIAFIVGGATYVNGKRKLERAGVTDFAVSSRGATLTGRF